MPPARQLTMNKIKKTKQIQTIIKFSFSKRYKIGVARSELNLCPNVGTAEPSKQLAFQ